MSICDVPTLVQPEEEVAMMFWRDFDVARVHPEQGLRSTWKTSDIVICCCLVRGRDQAKQTAGNDRQHQVPT